MFSLQWRHCGIYGTILLVCYNGGYEMVAFIPKQREPRPGWRLCHNALFKIMARMQYCHQDYTSVMTY